MIRRSVLTLIAFFSMVGFLAAQGSSPIQVNQITLNPSTFKAGDAVSVTVALKNTSTATYGCSGYKMSLNVFKAEPFTVTNEIWSAAQALNTPMAPGETRSVTFAAKFPAPNSSFPVITFQVWSPICGPDEFGQVAYLKCQQVPSWAAPAQLQYQKQKVDRQLIYKPKT
jgi:hypothetical protein